MIQIRKITKFLLASIFYHWEFLQSTLHESNSLLSNQALHHVSVQLKKAAVIKYVWNQTPNTPRLTGIPPHVLTLIEFHKLDQNYQLILTELKDNPEKTVNLMVNHLDGRANSNLGINLNGLFNTFCEQIRTEIRQVTNSSSAVNEAEPIQNQNETVSQWHYFRWSDGSSHVLPENFEFPKDKFGAMVEKWLLGDLNKNIAPLAFMSSADFGRISRTCRKRYNECKQLMSEVERIGRRKNVWRRSGEVWSVALVGRLKDAVREDFVIDRSRSVDRTFQFTWRTIHTKMMKKRQQQAEQNANTGSDN